ncbi:MAG: hypothetical protein ACR2K3_05010 [Nocardioides sp.]
MSQPGYERSEQQIQQERAAGAVSDVLTNLEWTLESARKGRKIVEKDGVDVNAELALSDLIKELERLRKRFTQDTFYAVDTRLI